jgi:hypothetical protein
VKSEFKPSHLSAGLWLLTIGGDRKAVNGCFETFICDGKRFKGMFCQDFERSVIENGTAAWVVSEAIFRY